MRLDIEFMVQIPGSIIPCAKFEFIITQNVKWEKRPLCGPGSEGSKGGGGALGAQILKKKDTAAGCVEWLCSIRSREKVLEMNPQWPDGAYLGKLLPFSSAYLLFCLVDRTKMG